MAYIWFETISYTTVYVVVIFYAASTIPSGLFFRPGLFLYLATVIWVRFSGSHVVENNGSFLCVYLFPPPPARRTQKTSSANRANHSLGFFKLMESSLSTTIIILQTRRELISFSAPVLMRFSRIVSR